MYGFCNRTRPSVSKNGSFEYVDDKGSLNLIISERTVSRPKKYHTL